MREFVALFTLWNLFAALIKFAQLATSSYPREERPTTIVADLFALVLYLGFLVWGLRILT